MKKRKIYLTSIGYRLLSIYCTIILFGIMIAVVFLVDKFNIVAAIFSVLVWLFCLFSVYISFNHMIKIKENKIIIKQIKKIELDLKSIHSIHLNDESYLWHNVIFFETDNGRYKINGYNMLKNKNNVKNTELLLITICNQLRIPFKHYKL